MTDPIDPTPTSVHDYANTCISYIEKRFGIALDFTPETLPILDHYLQEARSHTTSLPESLALLSSVTGCYVGEVLRGQFPLRWNVEHEDPAHWFLASENQSIVVFPIAIALIAIYPSSQGSIETLRVEPSLKKSLQQRLDLLPQVPVEEFVAPSTFVEIVEIAFDELQRRMN